MVAGDISIIYYQGYFSDSEVVADSTSKRMRKSWWLKLLSFVPSVHIVPNLRVPLLPHKYLMT